MLGDERLFSIVVCTMDRYPDLAQCLESLWAQTVPPSEVVVVDSSRSFHDADHLLSQSHKMSLVRVVRAPNKTLPQARNIGVRSTTGGYVAFLDDDVVLAHDYIEEILKVMNRSADVGAVTGRVVTSNGDSGGDSRTPRLTLGKMFSRIFFLYLVDRGDFRRSGWPTGTRSREIVPIQCLSGCNMIFRREVFESEVFDESLKGHSEMEDADISLRIAARWRILYLPSATLIHKCSPLSRQKERKGMESLVINHNHLFRKNCARGSWSRVAYVISVLGLLVTNLLRGHIEGAKGVLDGIRSIGLLSLLR